MSDRHRHISLKKLGVVLFLLNCFSCSPVYSANHMPDTSLRVAEQIEAIIQQSVPTANVGIVLEEAKTGRVLYERLSAKPFCPASNVKLLTAAASLLSLGSDYRFKTVIKIENKALQQGKLLAKNLALIHKGKLTELKLFKYFNFWWPQRSVDG